MHLAWFAAGIAVLSLSTPLAALTGEARENGWAMFLADSSGDGFRVILNTTYTGPGAVGIVARPTDPSLTMFTSSVRGIWVGANYEVSSSRTGTVTFARGDLPFSLELATGTRAATYEVAVWAAGDVETWEWEIQPLGTTTISPLSAGERTVFVDPAATSEGEHARASVAGGGAGTTHARYFLDVEHSFVGSAGRAETPPPQIAGVVGGSSFTHLAPGATAVPCPCYSPAHDATRSLWASGRHVIEWEGDYVHDFQRGPMIVAGADLPFTVP